MNMTIARDKSRLAETPLFLGMSVNDLDDIVATASLGLHVCARGKPIATAGDTCLRLCLLVDGIMHVESRAHDNGYAIVETVTAPFVIQPECLFGLTQLYTKTFTADTTCHVLAISKTEVMRLAERYDIIRLNIINILSTAAQKAQREPWRSQPRDIRAKIIRFIESRCLRPAGRKEIYIKMTRLAQETAESRLNISRELAAMQTENLIILRRCHITVPALERLIGR